MDYEMLWNELKEYLIRAVPKMYELGEDKTISANEEIRRKSKASGMDLVLQKMEELERQF